MKKFIIIAALIIILFTIGALFFINMLLFQDTAPSMHEGLERIATEEKAEVKSILSTPLAYTTVEEIEASIKRKRELELKDERDRAARRDEAFARQKAMETSLIKTKPQKTSERSPVEEPKDLEKKGVFLY